ncbi:MAG: NADH-quinone oxidoreductase subunit L [Acidimicrobiia bacterium]
MGFGITWPQARAIPAVQAALALSTTVALTAGIDGGGRWVRFDPLTAVVLGLVAIVGWVVVRYSTRYLAGDPRERLAAALLAATLAAVTVVIATNDVVVLALAWTATSLALHGLLTFFGDRPAAVAAAHKKFVLARCADACMIGVVVALGIAFDTTRIDTIVERATGGSLPAGAHVAAVLLAMAAILKCAQLPFHGWLIQVMEAPTPVSALLHAGVVNLGGFVLLRFAPLVDRSVGARTLLVSIGLSTVVVASLVMTTRISVKVALAWSTCAQMGFMLVQCGLGLWELAVLHLVAHSLYKAHAFLAAGGTVARSQRDLLLAHPQPPRLGHVLVATARASVATAAVAGVWIALPFVEAPNPAVWVFVGVTALAIVPLAMGPFGPTPLAVTIGVPVLYLTGHEVAAHVVGHGAAAPTALIAVAASAFVFLFAASTALVAAPHVAAVRRVRPWLYRGLFLDEWFTARVFELWPPPPPAARPVPTALA